ncbi:MAG: histidine kinase, partial [Haloechinothrix sp.]
MAGEGRSDAALAGQFDDRRVVDQLLRDLSGIVDPSLVGRRTAEVLAGDLMLPVSLFALRDPETDCFAMRGTWGTRTDQLEQLRVHPDQGMGGRAVAEHATVVAEDYLTDSRISSHFRPVVGREDLRGMAAVPVLQWDRPIGILYGAQRSVGRPRDGVIGALEQVAVSMAPVLAMALTAEQQLRRHLGTERQRVAGALHDNVGSMLFAISAAARRARELTADHGPDLCRIVDQIEQHTRAASEGLRGVLSTMAPSDPEDTVPVAAHRDLDDFSDRNGIPAHLVVHGQAALLSPAVERTILSCLRQALFNIERHAGAALVITTIDYQPGWVTLAVQDDGQGPPPEFEPRAVPVGDAQWG